MYIARIYSTYIVRIYSVCILYVYRVCILYIYTVYVYSFRASLVARTVKRLPTMREPQVRFLGQDDPLEKEMAIHSSTLAWKEEPERLQSLGSQRVRQD